MKISFNNPTSKKQKVTIWHNDQEQIVPAGTTIDLHVQKGDTVKYRVGKFAAVHTIDFQSTSAHFIIEPNTKLQAIAFGVILVALVILYFIGVMEKTIVIVPVVVVWLIGYEVALYSNSYRTKVEH
ncbi:hypothetical protein [Lacticaseibacillus hulanensis]|uniref:hypothetical protein n=1 Tax=Lacticaseibacillus hulanensis TaxID=2493111 RepID=UPI000FD7FA29|nr:hypothetical protein [Lacticaseibacillus hulanensis]